MPSTLNLILVAGLLACGTPGAAQVRLSSHCVGGSVGLGRSHQVGTPGGQLEGPHMRLHDGTHQVASLWYENRQANSPWTLGGGLTTAYRSYWMALNQRQERLLTRQLEAHGPGYSCLSAWLQAGCRLLQSDSMAVEGLVGLGIATARLSSFGSKRTNGGGRLPPAHLRIDYIHDPDEGAFTRVEPLLGLRVRHRSTTRQVGRLAWTLLFNVPTRPMGWVGYRVEETHGRHVYVAEGRWRTRLLAWSLGVSYDFYRWGRPN